MTVVLATVCADGVILGSDSQITDKGRGMTYPAQKLHPLGTTAAWGGSGARSVLTDVERRFSAHSGQILESEDIGRAIQEHVIPVMRHHYEHFIEEVPGEGGAGTPSAYVMAAGWRDGEPWIVEVNPSGMVSSYADIGFHAIGSGAPMAQQAGALLNHFHMQERSTRVGRTAVLRVLESLNLTSSSVGEPFSLCVIDDDGAQHLDADQIEEIREDVRRWEQAEQEVLDSLF